MKLGGDSISHPIRELYTSCTQSGRPRCGRCAHHIWPAASDSPNLSGPGQGALGSAGNHQHSPGTKRTRSDGAVLGQAAASPETRPPPAGRSLAVSPSLPSVCQLGAGLTLPAMLNRLPSEKVDQPGLFKINFILHFILHTKKDKRKGV